jgi:hypothetical protein
VFKEMGQAHDNTNIIIIAGYLISLKTLFFLFVLGKRLLYSRFWWRCFVFFGFVKKTLGFLRITSKLLVNEYCSLLYSCMYVFIVYMYICQWGGMYILVCTLINDVHVWCLICVVMVAVISFFRNAWMVGGPKRLPSHIYIYIYIYTLYDLV